MGPIDGLRARRAAAMASSRRNETDPAVLRCYALMAVAALFAVVSRITPDPISSQWANVVSAVLAAILMTHIVNMLLAKL